MKLLSGKENYLSTLRKFKNIFLQLLFKFGICKAACFLARGGTLEFLGKEKDSYTEKRTFTPIIDNNTIRGFVSYIDSYGNIISNIDKATFSAVGRGRNFKS